MTFEGQDPIPIGRAEPMTPAEVVQAYLGDGILGIGAVNALQNFVHKGNVDEIMADFPTGLRRRIIDSVVLNFPAIPDTLAYLRRTGDSTETREAFTDWVVRYSPGGATLDEFTAEGQARLSALPSLPTEQAARQWQEGKLSFREVFYGFLANLTEQNVSEELAKLPRELGWQVLDLLELSRSSFLKVFDARRAAGKPSTSWKTLRRWFMRNTHRGIMEQELSHFRRRSRGYVENFIEELPAMPLAELGAEWQAGRLAFLDAFYTVLEKAQTGKLDDEARRMPVEFRAAVVGAMCVPYAVDSSSAVEHRKEEGRPVEGWQALRRWAKVEPLDPRLEMGSLLRLEAFRDWPPSPDE